MTIAHSRVDNHVNSQRLLVLAPHTDDAELGCGGSIARFAEEGTAVHVVAFSSAEDSLPAHLPSDTLKVEYLEAMPRLGVPRENLTVHGFQVRRLSYHRQEILEELVRLKRVIDPDLVFMPSGHDVHQDHQVIHAEGLRAFKDVSLLGYELPWNHITFSAQAFVRLEARHIELKWNALQAYRSQLDLGRPYFEKAFLEGLARVRGVQAKSPYAEAFEVLHIRI